MVPRKVVGVPLSTSSNSCLYISLFFLVHHYSLVALLIIGFVICTCPKSLFPLSKWHIYFWFYHVPWALSGKNKFTVKVCRDCTTVKTYSSTNDPSIVCAPQVCVGSVKLYISVQLCTQKYSSSVQVEYSSTVYLYMNLYIKCNLWTDVDLSGVRKGNMEFFRAVRV